MNLCDVWPQLTEEQKQSVARASLPFIIGRCSVSNCYGLARTLSRDILEFIAKRIVEEKASEQ